ncbi:hypothetical protein QP994_08575 [Corynebacterium sp. MSK044]|uniref:hypothetical protein n=1 Tax=Corynebacterium sp. MSK044 TaxID=3050195 RepID=UPI00254DDBCA|nr:hypothetical protein [Corynebacterium sp. MSK044]MDK8797932.1 hypothetical protein [Corynebacterium sp. MSK044]
MDVSAEDLAWLSQRIGVFDPGAKAPSSSSIIDDPQAGLVVEPTGVAGSAAPVIALVGWPTGRHHSLIKAAEARLAVQEGAGEIWLAVDTDLLVAGDNSSASAVLADIIAVSQVVDEPARVGVVAGSVDKQKIEALARIAQRAEVAVLAVPAGADLPSTACELAVYGVETLEGAVDALYAGAHRVFITPASR